MTGSRVSMARSVHSPHRIWPAGVLSQRTASTDAAWGHPAAVFLVTGAAGVISCCSLGFEAIAALSSVYMQQQHVANVYNSEIHRLENKMICISKTRTFG